MSFKVGDVVETRNKQFGIVIQVTDEVLGKMVNVEIHACTTYVCKYIEYNVKKVSKNISHKVKLRHSGNEC